MCQYTICETWFVLYPQPNSDLLTVTSYNQPFGEERPIGLWLTKPKQTTSTSVMRHRGNQIQPLSPGATLWLAKPVVVDPAAE